MINIPEGQEIKIIESKSSDVLSQANSLIINNQPSYDRCAEFLSAIKGLKKEIDTTFDDAIKKAYETHKAIVSAKKNHYEPLESAERIIKDKSLVWIKEQKRLQEEEQRKIDEAARRAEEKRKAELEAQAKKHEEAGRLDKAEERREQAAQVVAPRPIVQEMFKKAEGQAITVTWKAEVYDLFALCNAIAKGELPETVVAPVMKELNALARTWQDKKAYDGVKFVKEENLSIRTR
jgi:hypothetical protein